MFQEPAPMRLAFATVILLLACGHVRAEERPNIVVILTDDQGWGDLSVNGNRNLSTPNIDSLARDGASFERFFVCPVCSPTRAEFLTGRYHSRGGVHGVSNGAERLNLTEKTIADALHSAGYTTGAFGKWHNGTQYPYHPRGRGFDEFYGFCSGHWGDYFDAPLEHNGKLVKSRGFLADDLTDHAMDFIDEHRQEPFFCYLALNTPHSPMQAPDKYWDKFADKELVDRATDPEREDVAMTRAALAMCENIDWNVGRVLEKLKERSLAERTIVVYFCDNGPNSWRYNGGMKGRKGSTDEGGVRSPLFVRWPGKIAAGTKVALVTGAIDLLPTLTQLAGVERVGTLPLDGVSMAPLLQGEQVKSKDRLLFSHWNGQTSVRSQGYRLDATGKLFDMRDDPGQRRNIAAQSPAEAERLTLAVKRWKNDVLPKDKADNRPFTVGYREFPLTYLPARDGVPHGNIERSAKAPNCSFFTNWTSVDDAMVWPIEVVTTGRYEAVLYYTCAKEDVGSSVRLTLGDVAWEKQIEVPHDPPLYGAEHDRVPRVGESYMKEFRPLVLGTMELKHGRGDLKLQATKIAGRQVADVRMIELRLVQ